MNVVLINPYELGRQPFALAQPAAWLKREGFAVRCLDLSLEKLDPGTLEDAQLVALYVGMHTATRIAVQALPRIRQLAPNAHICFYGLYAPMNEVLLRALGVHTVLGGEVEPALLALCQRLRSDGKSVIQSEPVIGLGRVPFEVPDRSGLPKLSRYAHLVLPDGSTGVAAFAEGSRGCKHLCRHCPVVPVYQGKFRIVPADVVMEDIRQQVREGATHVSFGDPDFFNGPTHGMRLARALHAAFPHVTFDATIKVQHLIDHAGLLPELRRCGCLFVTSAVEAVDDDILRFLDKNHTSRDFDRAVALTREAGIALAPTFVAFTPWTTLEGYIGLLERLVELHLVESVPPVQLTIRLLVPAGSYLLKLPGFNEKLQAFDPALLGYPWQHSDSRVDRMQQDLQALVARSEKANLSRAGVFGAVWRTAHEAAGRPVPELAGNADCAIPRLSEPWYCCAEPTDQQLQSF
ncbi:MAG: CUAEP/CCAEP-tail radical SAM protein [Proteobacteria bacterium]|nr:CUAEP/CCAEP-tail radical SAM protein [Pseudomonadota bacterium]MDA0984021.1 CUAEP/CCAEP-tail radical SAM protein [Pseudomonadota bacterium]